MKPNLKVMIFSWNAAGLRLCETTNINQARANRKAFFTKKGHSCLAPNFFEDIRELIIENDPALVIMSTQDEDTRGTYFHSDLLPSQLTNIGYQVLERNVMSGVGEYYTGSISGVARRNRIFEFSKNHRGVDTYSYNRGDPEKLNGGGLRMSIFARDDQYDFVHHGDQFISNFFSNNEQNQLLCDESERNVGALASYVQHPQFGSFAFIAVDFPSGPQTFDGDDINSYKRSRELTQASNLLCFNNIKTKFIDNAAAGPIDHLFIFGNFNCDIVPPSKLPFEVISDLTENYSIATLKSLQKYDEINNLKKAFLRGFNEGVNNQGPLFMPTWKLTRNRTNICNLTPTNKPQNMFIGCFDQAMGDEAGIGWHDRILFRDFTKNGLTTSCTAYNRFDVENIRASTHAGVIGLYRLS